MGQGHNERHVMITNYLHFGGDAIELAQDVDVENLVRRVQQVTDATWINVRDRAGNSHRILINQGANVRLSTTYEPAPSGPIAIPPTRSIADVGF